MRRISVILPFFNGDLYVQQCFDSLLRALSSSDEIIVVDDNHVPSILLKTLVEGFNNEHSVLIKYHWNGSNLGLAASLNSGIRLSSGKFIARMDQDDICLPHRFDVQLLMLKQFNLDLVFGGFHLVNEDNGSYTSYPGKNYSKGYFALKLHLGNFLCHSTFLAHRDFFDVVGLYRPKCEYAEDYNLWVRALYKGCCFGICQEELIIRRVHADQMSKRRWLQRWRTLVALHDGLFCR